MGIMHSLPLPTHKDRTQEEVSAQGRQGVQAVQLPRLQQGAPRWRVDSQRQMEECSVAPEGWNLMPDPRTPCTW